ncbi:SGNH/GDSL hydrolase family protein [Alteribacillus sp. YIM 98480]|uniref:SGNH/GDSL hydrolase family protein n=1 Tax=Alteribacillus sp. YIM 98480 TaxID=2606599 RepID=UPI00131CAEBB|nr:SGNH/GDSL hydrolase family protein [Alteribacillus sp. YIM 98480]
MKKNKLFIYSVVLFLILVSGAWTINSFSSEPPEDSSPVFTETKPDTPAPKQQEPDPPENEMKQEEEDTDAASENAITENDVQEAVAAMVKENRALVIDPDVKMVAIGDSLTQGVGDSTGNGGYVGILEKTIGSSSISASSFNIANYGKRGNRTDQLIKRMEEPAITSSIEEADVILLTIGANDIMHIVRSNINNLTYEAFADETDSYENRLEDVFQTIRSKNEEAPIYLIGLFNPFHIYFENIPELNQIVEDWNTIGQETAEEGGNASFIPIDDLFQQADESYYAEDNFHPNERGYLQIAERVFQYIKPEISTSESDETE